MKGLKVILGGIAVVLFVTVGLFQYCGDSGSPPWAKTRTRFHRVALTTIHSKWHTGPRGSGSDAKIIPGPNGATVLAIGGTTAMEYEVRR
jgi:hypothetical protein